MWTALLLLLAGACVEKTAPEPSEPPPVTPSEQEPIPIERWMVGAVDASSLATVRNAVAAGTFRGAPGPGVPFSQASTMLDALGPSVEDLEHHFPPGAGHWWDEDPDEPGADGVDWEPMIARMKEITFDPVPLSFDHRMVSPWVNPTHSFITVRSELDPAQDGKTEMVHGPFNQVFQRPFCFVWPDGARRFQELAAYLVSAWNLIGNGQACGLPLSRLTEAIARDHNLVWTGVPEEQVPGVFAVPMHWDETDLWVGASPIGPGALEFVFPAGDRLHAVMTATSGSERYLEAFLPFSSRSGMPDFAALSGSARGLSYSALGYFTPEWAIDARISSC